MQPRTAPATTNHTVALVIVGLLTLVSGIASLLVMSSTAHAQYIPELPTTTAVVLGDGTDQVPGSGGGTGVPKSGSLVTTGSDLGWLARLGAGAVVVGGLVMMSPARRRRRADPPQ